MPIDNIPSRLFRQADRIGDEPAYYAKREGAWQATTWACLLYTSDAADE